MRSPCWSFSLASMLLLAGACQGPAESRTTESSEAIALPVAALVRVPFEVDLGGWTSRAELLHPPADGPFGPGPYPVVLLIHGNGPHDMDCTLPGPGGKVALFAEIAEALAARGLAVVRYDKRFVKGPGRFDARFWRGQSTLQFTEDAATVLDAARSLPQCMGQRSILNGWSEGTAVAAALAARRDDVVALVLQGPVGLPYREMVRSWIEEVGVAYAQGPDGGPVTAKKLTAAQRGAGGAVAKLGASLLCEPAAFGAPLAVSSRIDRNGDGELDPATEIAPAIDAIVDYCFSPTGNCYIYAEGRTVPPATAQAGALRMPVLILQGENDASTPLRSGEALAAALAAAGNAEVTLRRLPGLGHTLGPAASRQDDCGRAPDPAVLREMAGWVAQRAH
ncbi:MAG: alpha/beta fold hydrolase [Planctomycetes bacterium]|nr:alpha/beta fold hydrolase [Planctomycetota bacterium]